MPADVFGVQRVLDDVFAMKKQKKDKQKMDIKEKKADAVQEKKLNAERENNEETTADLKKIKKNTIILI